MLLLHHLQKVPMWFNNTDSQLLRVGLRSPRADTRRHLFTSSKFAIRPIDQVLTLT
jgi:hypothetical protein